MNDISDMAFGNTELSPKLGLFAVFPGVPSANLFYNFTGKFYFELIRSWFSKATAVLVNAVKIVFGFRSKVKVVRVDTPRNVLSGAAMVDLLAFWNRPTGKNPRRYVSANPPNPTVCFRVSQAAPNDAVTSLFPPTIPHPMSGCNKHALPESAFKRFGKTLRGQVVGSNLDHSLVVLPRTDSQSCEAFSL